MIYDLHITEMLQVLGWRVQVRVLKTFYRTLFEYFLGWNFALCHYVNRKQRLFL